MPSADLVQSTVLTAHRDVANVMYPAIIQASCIASCPSAHYVAVGTLSGHVYVIDATNLEKPRIVHRLHIHQTPVLQMVYDTEGRFLITGSDDGNVFVADARPSSEFKVVGQTGRIIHSNNWWNYV